MFTGNYSAIGGLQGMHDTSFSLFDGANGTVWTSLAPCDQGRGSVFCTICPEGTYKKEKGVSMCLPCGNGPAHSIYTSKGYIDEDCPYQCLPGFTGLDCLTPFQEFLRQLGGPLVVSLTLASFAVIVLVVILLLLQYNSRCCFSPFMDRTPITAVQTARIILALCMVCAGY